MSIRPLATSDLPGLGKAWRESWLSTGLAGNDPVNEATLLERAERELVAGWVVLVAVDGDQVLGFMATKPLEAQLDQLFIGPASQGRGLGSQFMALAKAQMPQGFRLRTREANAGARRFYERHGLRPAEWGLQSRTGDPVVIYAWAGAD